MAAKERVCDTSFPSWGDCGTLCELMIVQGNVAGVGWAAPMSAGGDIYALTFPPVEIPPAAPPGPMKREWGSISL